MRSKDLYFIWLMIVAALSFLISGCLSQASYDEITLKNIDYYSPYVGRKVVFRGVKEADQKTFTARAEKEGRWDVNVIAVEPRNFYVHDMYDQIGIDKHPVDVPLDAFEYVFTEFARLKKDRPHFNELMLAVQKCIRLYGQAIVGLYKHDPHSIDIWYDKTHDHLISLVYRVEGEGKRYSLDLSKLRR